MRHFHSQNNGTSYPTNFNSSRYPPSKASSGCYNRISMSNNTNSNLNHLSLPYHQTSNSHYHENFSNHMNQSCNTFEQQQSHHHHSPASHPSTPVHLQQSNIYVSDCNSTHNLMNSIQTISCFLSFI